MAEKPIPGGILGHTFSHMIAGQFLRLKEADRFFYELGGQPHSFTLGKVAFVFPNDYSTKATILIDQLDEIRKVSMATIICLNSDNIRDIQPLTFRPASTM